MKDFDAWLLDSQEPEPELNPNIPEELADYNIDGEYYYPCRVCGEDTVVDEPELFDPDMHYCGGSPWCCP